MSKIQEAANYRGIVVEHAVGKTKETEEHEGLPQFVAKLQAVERWDAEEKTWISWSGREDSEIIAYLVLFDRHKNAIFHAKDVQKVFEWDGASLPGLNLLDLANAEVQFEVAEHTYNNKTSLQVQNIRGYNEEPGGSVKKLDDDELAKLDAQFDVSLKKLSGGPKPVKALGKSATATAAAKKKKTAKKNAADHLAGSRPGDGGTVPPPPPTAPTEEAATAEATKDVPEVPVEEAIEEFKKDNAVPPPPAAPVAPPALPTVNKKAAAAKTMTYEEAWTGCYAKKAKTVDDKTIAAAFTAAMHRQCPDVDEANIPGEDWVLIHDAVIGECG